MKHMFKSLFALSIAGLLFSCNNNADSKKDDSSKTPANNSAATTSTTVAPATTAPTLPMKVVTIYHSVKDYNQWRPGFDADSVARLANGLSLIAVEKSADKPNDVKIVLAASDMAKAKSFTTDPRLKDLMGKLGVISKPTINYWNIIRLNPENQISGGARVELVHKVKDFDAWVKVFDGEGPATRSANGMTDLALGRGIDDPNMVHLVFAVTDMAKVKARIADPALKKLMMEAGVVGAPTITFYNDATK